MSEYRSFLVPYDFSSHARAALYVAADLARRLDAGLQLIHVIQQPFYSYGGLYGGAAAAPPVDMTELRGSATKSLRDVASGIADLPSRPDVYVYDGHRVAEVVAEAAEKLDVDLIVMGTHGHTGLARVFLGSVAERTLRVAPCPVLTVRAPEDAGERENGK